MPCPDILTVLPVTHDSKLSYPGCSQHEPQLLLQPTSGVRGWVLSRQHRILVDGRPHWQCLNESFYIDKIWAENVLRLIRGALTAAVSDKFTVIHIIEKQVLPLAHFSINNNDATPVVVFPG